jgi:hypothetical protein
MRLPELGIPFNARFFSDTMFPDDPFFDDDWDDIFGGGGKGGSGNPPMYGPSDRFPGGRGPYPQPPYIDPGLPDLKQWREMTRSAVVKALDGDPEELNAILNGHITNPDAPEELGSSRYWSKGIEWTSHPFGTDDLAEARKEILEEITNEELTFRQHQGRPIPDYGRGLDEKNLRRYMPHEGSDYRSVGAYGWLSDIRDMSPADILSDPVAEGTKPPSRAMPYRPEFSDYDSLASGEELDELLEWGERVTADYDRDEFARFKDPTERLPWNHPESQQAMWEELFPEWQARVSHLEELQEFADDPANYEKFRDSFLADGVPEDQVDEAVRDLIETNRAELERMRGLAPTHPLESLRERAQEAIDKEGWHSVGHEPHGIAPPESERIRKVPGLAGLSDDVHKRVLDLLEDLDKLTEGVGDKLLDDLWTDPHGYAKWEIGKMDIHQKAEAYKSHLARAKERALGEAGKLGDDWIPSWLEGVSAQEQFEIESLDEYFESRYSQLAPDPNRTYTPGFVGEGGTELNPRPHRTGRVTPGGSYSQIEGLRSGGSALPAAALEAVKKVAREPNIIPGAAQHLAPNPMRSRVVGPAIRSAPRAILLPALAEVLAFEGGKMAGEAISPHVFEPLPSGGGEWGLPGWRWHGVGGTFEERENPYKVARFGKVRGEAAGIWDDRAVEQLLVDMLPSTFGWGEPYEGPTGAPEANGESDQVVE